MMNNPSPETTASPPPDDPFARLVEDLFEVEEAWFEDAEGKTRKVTLREARSPCRRPRRA